jgi:hypothetical protein
MENRLAHNIILTLLLVLSLVFFLMDGYGVYGIMTMFGAFLYLLWNDKGDDDNGDDYYKFNLR